MKIHAFPDVYQGTVHSENPVKFTEILTVLFGGQVTSTTEYVLYMLSGVGAWKVYNAVGHTRPSDHIPLKIDIDVSQVAESIRKELSPNVVVDEKGEKHWRLLSFKVGGMIIGHVHLANRPS